MGYLVRDRVDDLAYRLRADALDPDGKRPRTTECTVQAVARGIIADPAQHLQRLEDAGLVRTVGKTLVPLYETVELVPCRWELWTVTVRDGEPKRIQETWRCGEHGVSCGTRTRVYAVEPLDSPS